MTSTLLLGVFLLFWGYSNEHPVDDYDSTQFAMENPDLFGGDMLGFDTEDRNAVVDQRKIWPGGVIPYVQDPGLKETIRYLFLIERSFDHYHKHTCIKFVPRTTEVDYVRIIPGQGCYSYVGRIGGAQPLSLGKGCGHEGTIIHELGHAIGFDHEQNRSDRDQYLRIYWENIKEGMEDQFAMLKPHQNQLLTPFDYDSIMLYGSLAFSKDYEGKLRTMEGSDGRYLLDPMSKGKLSKSDIERIKKLYKCP